MRHDGQLVSELGVKRYLEVWRSRHISNIDVMGRRRNSPHGYEACRFGGCHGESYRTPRRQINYHEFVGHLNDISPFVAGAVDGIGHYTIRQPGRILGGAGRTIEGLGEVVRLSESDTAGENLALYNFIRVNVTALLNADLDIFDNPLSQIVFVVVNAYVSLISEETLIDMVKDGAIILEGEVDKDFLLSAIGKGLVVGLSKVDIDEAVAFLASKGERFAGRQVGKKVAQTIARILAAKIAKNIMVYVKDKGVVKRLLNRLRSELRPAIGGNSGVILVHLLKAQGWLDKAAGESRGLREDCPSLWRYLRYDLGGYDMIFFLINSYVSEYVDRLAVLERDPELMAAVMASLVKAGKTREIFFPN